MNECNSIEATNTYSNLSDQTKLEMKSIKSKTILIQKSKKEKQ